MKYMPIELMLVLALLFCPPTLAFSQVSVVVSNPDGSFTLDAARITVITRLEVAWRFFPGDNPEYADPGYEDSSWPLVRPGNNRSLASEHAPSVPAGQDWARLHLHILNATGPLAITIQTRNHQPFAVFANGKQIFSTRGYSSEQVYSTLPLAIVLPQEAEMVLAIHFVVPGRPVLHYFPIEQINLGQSETLKDKVYRDRIQEFNRDWLSYLVLGGLFLLIVPVGMTLFLAQRDRPEYLWLSIFCLLLGITYCGAVARNTGFLQTSAASYILISLCQAVALVASIELAASLAQFKRRAFMRLVQTMLVLSPLFLYLQLFLVWTISLVALTILWPGLIAHILFGAWRRGRKECGFLMLPITVLPMSLLIVQVLENNPDRFGDLPGLQVLGIGFQPYQLLSVLFLLGLLLVVLYRFIRVSKDEEAAAAELEAARSVQRLLIPSTPPATPGFHVESVYLPARQVGGDFFLILPAPDTATDPSLLAVIGDVSGKGLQAAMVVSTIIGGLRMQLSRRPCEILNHLNRALTGNVSGFATCCAILLHPDGRAILANAGNPSPYYDGEEVPTLPGLPLGIAPDITYDETTFILASGSRLSFVSDGVVEATSFPGKELFGFDRTRTISNQSATAIAEAACAFGRGAPQADDITVLTITLTYPPHHATSEPFPGNGIMSNFEIHGV